MKVLNVMIIIIRRKKNSLKAMIIIENKYFIKCTLLPVLS